MIAHMARLSLEAAQGKINVCLQTLAATGEAERSHSEKIAYEALMQWCAECGRPGIHGG